MTANGAGIGASVLRKEDRRFLTGKGRYTDDINLPGQLHAHILRSQVAHATLERVDVSRRGVGSLQRAGRPPGIWNQ